MRANHEALDALPIPFACFCHCVCEFPDLLYGVQRRGERLDEPPFFCERVYDGVWEGMEVLGAGVEAVQVEACLFGWVGKDVFFKRVIA